MRYPLAPIILLLLLSLSNRAGALSDDERAISDWVDQHQEQAVALLEETVNIGSGTMNHKGVRAVGDVMARELNTLGLAVRWIDMPESVNRAGHLFAKKPARALNFCLLGTSTPCLKRTMSFKLLTGQATSLKDRALAI